MAGRALYRDRMLGGRCDNRVIRGDYGRKVAQGPTITGVSERHAHTARDGLRSAQHWGSHGPYVEAL